MRIQEILAEMASGGASCAGGVATVNSGFSLGMKKRKKGSEKAGIYEDEPHQFQDQQAPSGWSDEQWAKHPQAHNPDWVEWKIKQHAQTGEPLELVNASGSRGSLAVGDLRKFGWVKKQYTHDSSGEVDGLIWHLSRDLPFPIVVSGKTYNAGDSIGDDY